MRATFLLQSVYFPSCCLAFRLFRGRSIAPPTDHQMTTSLVVETNQTESSASSTAFLATAPIQVFPSNQFQELQARYGIEKVKLIHVVRHAEGTHNTNKEYKDPINTDARLTAKGIEQCKALAKTQLEIVGRSSNNNHVAVISSSMTRCIQTALYSFPDLADNPKIPFIAHEGFRETVNYNCDRRRPKSEIAQEFPRIDFSLINDEHDAIWSYYRDCLPNDWDAHMESAHLHDVAKRAWEGFQFVAQREESEIVLCTHSAFLRCIMNYGQEGGVPQLVPQRLDPKETYSTRKQRILEYNNNKAMEDYMRPNYENCEMRSFCLLFEAKNHKT